MNARATAAAAAAALLLGLVTAPAGAQSVTTPPDGSPLAKANGGPGVTDRSGPAVLVETEGKGSGLWVVQLDEPSLATYSGGIGDLAPTSPQVTGADRLDVEAPASEAYLEYLAGEQDDVLDRINDTLDRTVDVEFRYRNVLNGVAVEIDDDEAAALLDVPGVAAVYRDVERELQTDVSHEVIKSASIWNGETGTGVGTRGEGVVVGIIDSGINPDHPSFAATDAEGYTHTNPYGAGVYAGVCDPDHPRHEDICNDKLIGAWNFHPSAANAQDADSHGSHVAGTAAGNVHEATFTVGSEEFTRTVQGVAPRANIISYLVCSPLCPGTSSVAAVEQAIADGVDVLNYSISGADNPWADFVDRAFLEAFNAGIFVAAAAGNDGPGASTTAHTGPWNAAVAATTLSRAFVNSIDVVGPAPVPSALTGLPATPGEGVELDADIEGDIRDAQVVDPDNANGCRAFPAGAFTGTLALIDRGACTFAEKVNFARAAGATGVIVANHVAGPPTVMGGLGSSAIPAVMIDNGSAARLREFMAEHAPAATSILLHAATSMIVEDGWEDIVAGFSSRGPSRFDVITPTFAAPGVNVLAAAAARGGDAGQYAVLGGTSMASPHGAGSAALLKALHPQWSPAQIQSALASTARSEGLVKEDGVTPADPYDIGSGQLDLDNAGRVGLVMDETHSNFLAADPAAGGDPKALNIPVAVDDNCAGTCSFTRTVENIAAVEATYTAEVSGAEGLSVSVEPAQFTVTPGSTQTVVISVDTSGAAKGEPAFAEVGFSTDAEHADGRPIATVHYPVVVTPAAVEPRITLNPGSITSTQGIGDIVTHTVTIGNTGNADLNWSVHEDDAVRTPYGPATRVTSTDHRPQRSGSRDLAPTTSTGGESPRVALPDRPQAQGGLSQTITHSVSQAIVAENSVACTPDQGNTTTDNAFLRTFTLTDFGIESEFDVTAVEFGIESVTGTAQELTVNVYTMVDPGAALTYGNLELIGTSSQSFAPQQLTLATVPVTGTADAGATLVVEVAAPNSAGVSGFWPGSNSAGQSAPSYIRSNGCGMSEPADLAGIGFANMHLVMNVTGETEAPVCTAPGQTPWVDVTPLTGTVAPGASQQVEITFDSTGLAGGVYEADLCVQSDDPRRSLAVVPLELDVSADPVIDVRPGSIEVTQQPGEVTEHTVTIGNTGSAALDWSGFTEYTSQLPLAGTASSVETVPPAGVRTADGEARFATDAGASDAASRTTPGTAPDTSPSEGGEGARTLSHSASTAIVAGNSVACTVDRGVTTLQNSYLRTFTLADFGILGEFHVSDVTFGVENVTGAEHTLTVNLYALGDQPLEYANLTILGTANVTLAPQTRSLVEVPVTGRVPAGATLVVEVDAPDMNGVGGFYIGSNGSGQSAASYVASAACGFPEPSATADLGRPDMHIVMSATGSTEAPVCTGTSEASWLSLDPAAGTVGGGESADVTVTVDTTGLAAGEYRADLCITSNDPATPVVAVPVNVTVPGGELTLSAEAYQAKGIWYADLTWSGATSAEVDIHRDGELVATVNAQTGSYTDTLGRIKKGDEFTYRLCAAGTDACTDPLVLSPRGDAGRTKNTDAGV